VVSCWLWLITLLLLLLLLLLLQLRQHLQLLPPLAWWLCDMQLHCSEHNNHLASSGVSALCWSTIGLFSDSSGITLTPF
jgi:hypothetical protein